VNLDSLEKANQFQNINDHISMISDLRNDIGSPTFKKKRRLSFRGKRKSIMKIEKNSPVGGVLFDKSPTNKLQPIDHFSNLMDVKRQPSQTKLRKSSVDLVSASEISIYQSSTNKLYK